MREDAAAVDVDLVANGHVVTENSHVLQTSPAADGAVPADDGRLDPSVVLDLGATEQDAALEANTITNNNIGADGDVGSYPAVLANLGGGVDQDVAAVHVGLGRGREILATPLGEGGEVQASTAEEVLGLTDIHPEAVEVERMQLVVLDHGGEGLLLDRGRAQLNALQNGGVEDVQAGVDAVADVLDGLLDETVDARRVVGLVDNYTVLGGLLDLGDDNGTLIAVVLVELKEILEGVVANDIGVEDEEGRVVLEEDLLGKLQRAGGVERLGLDRELNLDVVLLLVLRAAIVLDKIGLVKLEGRAYLGKELFHDLRAVVDRQDDVGDTNGDESLNLVHNHGLVAELDEGLGERQGLSRAGICQSQNGSSRRRSKAGVVSYEGTEASAKAADKDES